MRRAVKQGVAIVGTLDTQSHCRGVASNARRLVKLGARLLYGTDLAHVEVPHGIDAQELHLLVGAGMSTRDALGLRLRALAGISASPSSGGSSPARRPM